MVEEKTDEGSKEEFLVVITNLLSTMDPACFVPFTPLPMNGDKNLWSFNEIILRVSSNQEWECQRAHHSLESSLNSGETYIFTFMANTGV